MTPGLPGTLLVLWVACSAHGPAGPTEPVVTDGVDGVPGDTGEPWRPPACMWAPCVVDLSTRVVEGENEGANLGYSLAIGGDVAMAGALRGNQPLAYPDPYAVLLSFPELEQEGRWHGKIPFTLTGSAVAVGPADAEGVHALGVGEANGTDFTGAYLLDEDAPDGGILPQARAWVQFQQQQYGGTEVGFARVGSDEREWFVVAGPGAIGIAPLPGELAAVPADATGEIPLDDVPLRISGEPGFAQAFAAWDPGGDGQLDLAVTSPSGVSSFTGPWVGWRTDGDRDGGWTEPDALDAGAGARIENLGDLDGDGRDDLAFASPTWGTDPFRTGRAYVVPGAADLRFGPAADLPLQIHGLEEGEGMGWGLRGADVNGDGAVDLVVAATGVFPGDQPGSVLVYPGPLAEGTFHASDAAAVVFGEYPYDLFGRAIAAGDADGDAKADLLVGSQGWPAGYGTGKVWLVPGAALFP